MIGENGEKITGEFAEALNILVKYLNGKGQLPRLQNLALLTIMEDAFRQEYGINIVDYDRLIELSIHSPVVVKPLWIEAVEKITKINSQTNIVTELSKRKRLE